MTGLEFLCIILFVGLMLFVVVKISSRKRQLSSKYSEMSADKFSQHLKDGLRRHEKSVQNADEQKKKRHLLDISSRVQQISINLRESLAEQAEAGNSSPSFQISEMWRHDAPYSDFPKGLRLEDIDNLEAFQSLKREAETLNISISLQLKDGLIKGEYSSGYSYEHDAKYYAVVFDLNG